MQQHKSARRHSHPRSKNKSSHVFIQLSTFLHDSETSLQVSNVPKRTDSVLQTLRLCPELLHASLSIGLGKFEVVPRVEIAEIELVVIQRWVSSRVNCAEGLMKGLKWCRTVVVGEKRTSGETEAVA